MSAEISHIIQTQRVEITFEDLDEAFGLQDRIAEVFYERIQPQMTILFNELFGKEDIFCLDQLVIDCGILPKKKWEEEWVNQTLFQLKNELRKAAIKQKANTDLSDAFIYYLQNGNLPWNSRVPDLLHFENSLIVNEPFILALQTLIREYPNAAKRLAYIFSKTFKTKIIDAFKGEADTIRQELMQLNIQRGEPEIKPEEIDYAIFIALANKTKAGMNTTGQVFRRANEIKEPLIPKQKQFENQKRPGKSTAANEQQNIIYVKDAGLVILLPFIAQLFENLHYTKKGNWLTEQYRQRACFVLQFLASGDDDCDELKLVFPKIICGISVDAVMKPAILTADEKNACEELLVEAIRHWAALKNTSIASFRHTFLQRKGQISRVDTGWRLQVEHQAVDVLLGQLPWGIGTAKMPWMEEIIFTEW